ncbi:MAG TPA: integrase core domain-containing protein, partial [Candidatus Limnocylindria bacterium]|nr:integrase core domain-containing protein [Candidatus Limnocylindria bacterium]
LVEAALQMAVTLRGHLPTKVIFHADRGTQYTSTQIAEVIKDLPVLSSMGRTGVCWDNAPAESFWSTFKTEFHNRRRWATKAEAKQASACWIEERYNRKRRHSSIGMLTPVRFEELTLSRHKPPERLSTRWGQPHSHEGLGSRAKSA